MVKYYTSDVEEARLVDSIEKENKKAYATKYNLDRANRNFRQAEYEVSLTAWQALRGTALFLSITTAIILSIIAYEVFAPNSDGGAYVLGGLAALVALFGTSSFIETYYSWRARATTFDDASKELKVREAEDNEVVEHHDALITRLDEHRAEKARKEKEEASAVELLTAMKASTSRDATAVETDAVLWRRVEKNVEDVSAWEQLKNNNGWSDEFLTKMVANNAPIRSGNNLKSAANSEEQYAGFAG